MLTRRFGRTNMNLSVLSFGAMRIPPEDEEDAELNLKRAFATLRQALDVGINHIETARGYGLSEEIIGKALAQGLIKRDEFYLTTKIGPRETAAEFEEALADSMARMGVSYVDNLDIHGINTPELLETSTRPDGCLAAVHNAIKDGRVGHIGFSTHGSLEVILDTIKTDLFESVNLHYYYINQRNRPAVLEAIARDMGVFIISPTDKGGQLFNPPARLKELCSPLSPIEFNQRWLLSQPEVHTLSLGAANPEEFEPHLKMANVDGPLNSTEIEILKRLDNVMAGIGETWCNFCQECLPCPEDVAIPEVLRLRNLVKAYEMDEFGKYRYKMLAHKDPETGEKAGGIGHWLPGAQGNFCTECGDCLPRCPMNLQIPTLLKEAHSLMDGEVGKRLWD